jgi:hypothetical protein
MAMGMFVKESITMNSMITNRGFSKIEFNDIYNQECSLQKSSLARKPAIWFGRHENRMHLDQEMVEQLIPFLQEFVKTGRLSNPDDK